jgi:hypothetical protein
MTHDEYIKKRDESIFMAHSCPDKDECPAVMKAQQAIDELMLSVIGEDDASVDIFDNYRNSLKASQRSIVKGKQ